MLLPSDSHLLHFCQWTTFLEVQFCLVEVPLPIWSIHASYTLAKLRVQREQLGLPNGPHLWLAPLRETRMFEHDYANAYSRLIWVYT